MKLPIHYFWLKRSLKGNVRECGGNDGIKRCVTVEDLRALLKGMLATSERDVETWNKTIEDFMRETGCGGCNCDDALNEAASIGELRKVRELLALLDEKEREGK